MSFVYAFQDEEGITVISDTKIGIDQNVKGWESQQMKLNIEAFGIISAIQSGIDDSVGGVIVTVKANKNKPVFGYWEKFVSCPINQCIKPNENLILSDGPEKGYYTYQIYQSKQNVALYFLEGEFGVIYSSIGEEKELNMEHLYLPHKVKVPQIYFDAYAWQIEADRGIYLESYTREDRLKLLSKERDCYSVSDKHFFIYDKWIKHLIGNKAKK